MSGDTQGVYENCVQATISISSFRPRLLSAILPKPETHLSLSPHPYTIKVTIPMPTVTTTQIQIPSPSNSMKFIPKIPVQKDNGRNTLARIVSSVTWVASKICFRDSARAVALVRMLMAVWWCSEYCLHRCNKYW
jgi:hypothetical protein